MKSGNPYLAQAWCALPRLLALFDRDPTSPTFGTGDRFYWAWKLIDFGNGTFQGAAHGLARLVDAGLLPPWLPEPAALRRIEAMFQGAGRLRRRNGSLEEAFPHESSFCVTALVAFDLLSAIELLGDRLDAGRRAQYLDTVRPMVGFLLGADEHHAFISNHLATAAAALLKWDAVSGETRGAVRAAALVHRILSAQSPEGWFREYEVADPGYQTLATCYLADIHQMRPDLQLNGPLHSSLRFLWHFAHPDGSFGGLYGSRNTRFYFPAGVEGLARDFPEAAALARFMRRSVADRSTVTLDCMDEPNLVPMFNSYCQAASLVENEAETDPRASEATLPCLRQKHERTVFQEAGLLVDRGPRHYTVISLHKGGVCCHFADNGAAPCANPGLVVRDRAGRLYSTQAHQADNTVEIDGDVVRVRARLTALKRPLPTPMRFSALRLLSETAMRSRWIREKVKRALVAYLITGKTRIAAWNRRTIRLGEGLQIDDRLEGRALGLTRVPLGDSFSAIHMASQGYWQRQDEAA